MTVTMAIVLSHLDSPILMVLQTLQQVAIWVGHTACLASGGWTRRQFLVPGALQA